MSEYPQLRLLAWNLTEDAVLTPEQAFSLYERNWRHIDQSALCGAERRLIEDLIKTVGNGHLLV